METLEKYGLGVQGKRKGRKQSEALRQVEMSSTR